jgi:hypothetical protein
MITGREAVYKGEQYHFSPGRNGCIISHYRIQAGTDGFYRPHPSSDRLIKDIRLSELSFVFDMETTVIYKGDIFKGYSIVGNEIVIGTHDSVLAERYNMEAWDRYDFYLHADLKDVEEITQRWIPVDMEKLDKPPDARKKRLRDVFFPRRTKLNAPEERLGFRTGKQ